jgi:hypothetical protein
LKIDRFGFGKLGAYELRVRERFVSVARGSIFLIISSTGMQLSST